MYDPVFRAQLLRFVQNKKAQLQAQVPRDPEFVQAAFRCLETVLLPLLNEFVEVVQEQMAELVEVKVTNHFRGRFALDRSCAVTLATAGFESVLTFDFDAATARCLVDFSIGETAEPVTPLHLDDISDSTLQKLSRQFLSAHLDRVSGPPG